MVLKESRVGAVWDYPGERSEEVVDDQPEDSKSYSIKDILVLKHHASKNVLAVNGDPQIVLPLVDSDLTPNEACLEIVAEHCPALVLPVLKYMKLDRPSFVANVIVKMALDGGGVEILKDAKQIYSRLLDRAEIFDTIINANKTERVTRCECLACDPCTCKKSCRDVILWLVGNGYDPSCDEESGENVKKCAASLGNIIDSCSECSEDERGRVFVAYSMINFLAEYGLPAQRMYDLCDVSVCGASGDSSVTDHYGEPIGALLDHRPQENDGEVLPDGYSFGGTDLPDGTSLPDGYFIVKSNNGKPPTMSPNDVLSWGWK